MENNVTHTQAGTNRGIKALVASTLRNFLLWFLLFSFFVLAFGHLRPYRYFLPYKYSPALKMVSFIQSRPGARVIFIGSSLTNYGIRPAVFHQKMKEAGLPVGSIFNLGMNSTEITAHYYIVRDYLRGRRKPVVLFQEIGARSLNVNSERRLEAWRYFSDWSDIPVNLYRSRSAAEREAALSPLWRGFIVSAEMGRLELGRRIVMGYRVKHEGEEPLINYKILTSRGTFEDAEEAMRRTVQAEVLRQYEPNAEMIRYLTGILDICRERGIYVVLLHYPLSKSFRSILGQEIEARFNRIMRQVLTRYPVPYLDLSNVPWADDRSLFWDPQHPTIAGAQKLSTEITDRFIRRCGDDLRSIAKKYQKKASKTPRPR